MSPTVEPGGEARAIERLLGSLDAILGLSGDGLLAFDRDYRYLFWSPVMERITGMTAPEVLGRVACEVFPFLEAGGLDENLRGALAGKSSTSERRRYDIPETRRSGWFDAWYGPLVIDGAVVAGVCIVRDITAAKVADERLRETEARFKNMADSSPVMLWMAGTDSLCTFFNQTWLDFTGRTQEEEWGVGWADCVHPEDCQRCLNAYVEAFGQRRAFELEYRLRRRDGVYRWLLDRGVPRFGPDGTFAGYIGSCVDITDRKEREAALHEAVRQRDEFLSIASHELRTPLTTLRLQVQWLERALAGPAEVGTPRLARSVRLAAMQTERLAQLVELLLDVSRISGGALTLERTSVDLAALASEVVDRLRPSLEAAGCATAVRAVAVVGSWDRLRLELVITNLLVNAAKFGAGKPIEVEVEAGADSARLRVRDHGIGVPASDQPHIFERFARAVSASHYGGFGLGLWISREIVAAHGGTIEVESEPGAGASFTVTLPVGGSRADSAVGPAVPTGAG